MQRALPSSRQLTAGVFYTLLGAVCFGTTGTIQAFAPEGCQPMAVGTMRLVVGGLVMLLWVHFRSGFTHHVPWPKKATFTAAAGIVIFQILFFQSLVRTGVAVGTVIAIGFGPMAGGIIEYLLRGTIPSRSWFTATVLALCGLVLLSIDDTATVDMTGIIMALGAGAGYALYAANSQTILADRSPQEMIAILFTFGGIAMSPILFVYDISWMFTMRGFISIVLIGVIGTAMAYSFFATGLAILPLSSGLTLGLAEPLVATLFGILLLGEVCSFQTAMGICIIFSGMIVIARNPS
ncbi:DMT family transporter [Halodesulfovibrio marinisediminis]|uniref:Drug/metabolite transporter, DME family n=1 Tax=Halodesulfovibrio marinisediminis DSM 17456 TaxID=1121457 RepID=A0A1N6GYW1_9BACT|nr:DMT family transporter [Halodesulfovibrio marinisediminis]SIO12753.1 drug/metabolite transporter, DME family [Halodesulfovibrio marinisediminis DSM 17456]